MRHVPGRIKEQFRPLYRGEYMRATIVIGYLRTVWLHILRKRGPVLAIGAERMQTDRPAVTVCGAFEVVCVIQQVPVLLRINIQERVLDRHPEATPVDTSARIGKFCPRSSQAWC